MCKIRSIGRIFLVAVMVVGTSVALGQAFPNRPIRILASEAGGFLDITVRLISPDVATALGQPIIVENRGSGNAAEFLVKANPDGYTLAMGAGVLWLTPLTQKTSYDPVKDLAPVTTVVTYPYILAMHPSGQVKSVKELIDLAKAKPGVLNAGASADPGGSSWLGVELFKAMAAVNIVRVPYKGSGSGIIALLSNQVQMYFLAPGAVAQYVKAGKLNALAITSLEPFPLVPGVPTVAASGLPGFELILLGGIMAPAGTPPATITRLNQEMVRVLNRPDIKEKFLKEGAQSLGSSPTQFAAKMQAEMAKWGKVLKDAGVKPES